MRRLHFDAFSKLELVGRSRAGGGVQTEAHLAELLHDLVEHFESGRKERWSGVVAADSRGAATQIPQLLVSATFLSLIA